jgi:hypothetical protein
MATDDAPSVGRIVVFLGVFLVVGVPIVAVLWNAVNEIAKGDLGLLAIGLPALALFVVFLVVFARQLQRLE